MDKILTIIWREYNTKIFNKVFLIITFVSPFFYALLIIVPQIVRTNSQEVEDIYILDNSGVFASKLTKLEDNNIKFIEIDPKTEMQFEELIKTTGKGHLLKIPNIDIENPRGIELISFRGAGLKIHEHIKKMLESILKDIKIKRFEISEEKLLSLNKPVLIESKMLSEDGYQKTNTHISSILAILFAISTYLFVFMYSSWVLRSVQEEKQNRIIEIIILSVKPFQIMAGKIIGIAMVAFTQFFAWILLTLVISLLIGVNMFSPDTMSQSGIMGNTSVENILTSDLLYQISQIDFFSIISFFIFFFLGGYLLYASLFAAIGAVVDNHTDTQQFMLPISLPLIISIIFLPNIIENPNSDIAFWLSIIPFSSPVAMMARIAFGVPDFFDIIISMTLLITTFIFTTWIAGKIYRVGILIYGKKMTYKDLCLILKS